MDKCRGNNGKSAIGWLSPVYSIHHERHRSIGTESLPLMGSPVLGACARKRHQRKRHHDRSHQPIPRQEQRQRQRQRHPKSSHWLHSDPLRPTPGQRIMVHMETLSGSNRGVWIALSPSLPWIPVTLLWWMQCGIILRVSMSYRCP
jgi:hypothetical protein